MQTRQRIFNFNDIQVLYFFLDKIRKVLTSHALLSLTVAKLSTLKTACFFGPTCMYMYILQLCAIVGSARIVCGAGSMQRYGVCPSVCLAAAAQEQR